MKRAVACVILGLATFPSALRAAGPDSRPAIAVVPFETTIGGRTLPPPMLGTTAAQILLDRLVKADTYRVFDGEWLQPRRTPGPLRDAMSALMVNARAAGVDFVVLGSITRFSVENQHRGLGGIGFRFPILGAFQRQKTQMVLSVVARMVDAQSGEIVASASGEGIADRSNLGFGGGALVRAGGAGGYSSGSSQFGDALIDDAVQRAMAKTADGLLAAGPRLRRADTDR